MSAKPRTAILNVVGLTPRVLGPETPRLSAAIDDALGRLITDGRLKALYDRWDLAGRQQMLLLRDAAEVPPARRGSLADLLYDAPRAPLVANITAGPVHDPDIIRGLLVEQVTGRVRWRESMVWLAGEGGITRFAEAGAGKVLSGMAKRIAPDAEAVPLNSPADLEAFAKSL